MDILRGSSLKTSAAAADLQLELMHAMPPDNGALVEDDPCGVEALLGLAVGAEHVEGHAAARQVALVHRDERLLLLYGRVHLAQAIGREEVGLG